MHGRNALHSIGKAIQCIGGKGQQRHQNGIHRDDIWPDRAPKTVSAPKQSCSSNERSIMSRLSASRVRILPRHALLSSVTRSRMTSTRQMHPQTEDKRHSAIAVASAAPCTVHVQAHHQPEIEHDVEEVAYHQQDHRRASILCTPSNHPSRTRLARRGAR